MREDNGVFRYFSYYKVKSVEMLIVLADYLQLKACAWHGPAQLVSGSRGPPQLDLRLDGESPFSGQDRGLTADVRLSTILPAIMLERWHHSSVSYSTQIQLAPQSSKLGPWREIHIQGYSTAEPSDWC